MLNPVSRRLHHLLKAASRSISISLQSQRGRKHHHIRLPVTAMTLRRSEPQTPTQRLLIRQGTQMHATSLERGDHCSIAILDSRGMVVAWHDSLPGAGMFDRGVIGTHVSQFYPETDVAVLRADRQLLIASTFGADTREGWYRRANGSVFWGVTVIEALQLKNGELQGYSHVTRHSRHPRGHGPMAARHVSPQAFMYAGVPAAA